MAAWAAAEWAGWICKKDGRAQRVQTARISRRYAENSNWGRVLARPPARLARTWPPYSRQNLSPAEREAFFWARIRPAAALALGAVDVSPVEVAPLSRPGRTINVLTRAIAVRLVASHAATRCYDERPAQLQKAAEASPRNYILNVQYFIENYRYCARERTRTSTELPAST